MKFGPVTKFDKRNKTTSKKNDVLVIFPIFDQFGAIQKPDSGRIVRKTYIFIKNNLLSYKK